MQKALRLVPVVAMAMAVSIPATASAVREPAEAAAGEIVVRAKFKRLSDDKRTITYSSSKGTYSATWIGVRRYRLSGKITGRRLNGRIRTRQASSGTRYKARGSGRLGKRRVRISGGGPNTLRTATLTLSWP
jgi:hypothetical protein